MPEGDTVYLAAKRLDALLSGQRIDRSDVRLPSLATIDFAGIECLGVRPVGKHLLFRFSNGTSLHTHFRMDGSWHIYRAGQRWKGGPMHAVRLVLHSGDAVAVGYRLHDVLVLPTTREADVIGHLGPDILDDSWDAGRATDNVRACAGRSIGDVLVDQRVVAGIGNIYRCETLFLAGITPFTPVEDISDDEVASTLATARTLMMRNRDRSSQATTGDERDAHFVYGKRRSACRRCGTPIRSQHGVGQQRPSEQPIFWCPRCQVGTQTSSGP